MHSNESKQVFCIILLTRRVSHHTVALLPFVRGATSGISTFITGRPSICVLRWSQHVINFNYKNIIVLYSAGRCFCGQRLLFVTGIPWSKSLCIFKISIRDFANYRDISKLFVVQQLSYSNFLKKKKKKYYKIHIRRVFPVEW